ncbi:MAG TPA: HupE/UreJ family protein [Cytophagaceae bacterium]
MTGLLDFYKLGFTNIIYVHAFNHLLFIIVLCGVYTIASWKRVLWFLIIFFSGYIISFLLYIFDFFSIPAPVLTYFMPLTTIATAVSNYFLKRNAFINKYPPQNHRFGLAFLGGIIHGFAIPINLKQHLLHPIDQLLEISFFNLGVVSSILTTVGVIFFVGFFLTYFIRVNLRELNLLLSGACAGIAIYILVNVIIRL